MTVVAPGGDLAATQAPTVPGRGGGHRSCQPPHIWMKQGWAWRAVWEGEGWNPSCHPMRPGPPRMAGSTGLRWTASGGRRLPGPPLVAHHGGLAEQHRVQQGVQLLWHVLEEEGLAIADGRLELPATEAPRNKPRETVPGNTGSEWGYPLGSVKFVTENQQNQQISIFFVTPINFSNVRICPCAPSNCLVRVQHTCPHVVQHNCAPGLIMLCCFLTIGGSLLGDSPCQLPCTPA